MGEVERVDSNINTDVVARAEFIIAVLGGEQCISQIDRWDED